MMIAAVAFGRQSHSILSNHTGTENAFSVSVSRLLDRIDCRPAETSEQLEAVSRLRYEAYLREGAISANSSGTFADHYDESDNAYLFGLYVDGELASSVRLHIGSREHPDFPSLHVFPDILQPQIDAGKVILDTTRFVADEKLSRRYRGLAYVTLRLSYLAGLYFNADLSLAAVRTEHQAFYRRTFHHRLISEPRPYPHLDKPICLMTTHCPTIADDLYRRFPFFRSTFFERRMLFERSPAHASHEFAIPARNVASLY
jgi:N-acyl-L-homoserine lactone synthetase